MKKSLTVSLPFFNSRNVLVTRIIKSARVNSIIITALTLASVLISFKGFSQDPAISTIISPTPNSASFAKSVELPVDLSTGVPQIGFPLYEIRSRKLSYPISLSYNASGIKVDEVASWVGLGFNLNAGGVVTRVMRGRPDETPNGFLSYASAIPNSTDVISLPTLTSLANGDYDMIPDLFYFNTGTIGGKLMFDNTSTLRIIPKSDTKVTIAGSLTDLNSVFNFVTPDGTTYEFQAGEKSTAHIYGNDPTYTSTWYLSKILSADKLDTIRFTYVVGIAADYTQGGNGLIKYYYNAPAGASRAQNELQISLISNSTTVSATRYLSRIDYNGGKVEFSCSSSRTDDPAGQRLESMIIYSRDPISGAYSEIKRINFTYDYFQNIDSGTRLRLLSFQERSPLSHTNPPHQFFYSSKKLSAPGSFAQDHWGYYNGAISNSSLIPAYSFGAFVVSTNSRDIDTTYTAGFLISKVISPMGGSTQYFFESNRYLSGGVEKAGPGMRIRKTITRDPFSEIKAVNNYEYKDPINGLSSGKLMNSPSYFTDLPVSDLAHTVTYNYNCLVIMVNPNSVGSFEGPPLIYQYATIYKGDDINVAGKTDYAFSTYASSAITYPYTPQSDRSWRAGKIISEQSYAVVANNPTIVSKRESSFPVHSSFTTIKGLKVAYNKILFGAIPYVTSNFTAENYYDSVRFQYLSQSKTTSYEQGSGTVNLTTSQNFFHEKVTGTLPHLRVTRLTTETSDSNIALQKEFKYPFDYAVTGVFATLQGLNMNAYPVETTTSEIKGGTTYVTGYSKTDFFEWSPARVYPITVYRSFFIAPVLQATFNASPSTYYRPALTFNKYDSWGFLQESQRAGDIPQSVIFDGKLAVPTASINGSAAVNTAYSSFETLDPGQWGIVAGTQALTHPFTVNDFYPISSFTLAATTTVSYTYTVTKTSGPSPVLTFSKIATTAVVQNLTLASGSGNVSLGAGTWTATLSWPANVTSVVVNLVYPYTYQNPPNIVATAYKTGAHSLLFNSSHTVSKTTLLAGDYWLTYYLKGGTLTVAVTGSASVLNTTTGAADPNGWSLIRKMIRIVNTTDAINLTSSNCYVDELRLYPSRALMATTSIDALGRAVTSSDANLLSQFYEYDEWGRIKLLRDNDLNIVKQYLYQTTGN